MKAHFLQSIGRTEKNVEASEGVQTSASNCVLFVLLCIVKL